MNQANHISKPALTRNTFWDTRLENLDYDRYSRFIITRVFERGLDSEIREAIRYYGNKRIVDTLTSVDQLMPRAFTLSKRLFNLSNEDYKCFGKKQQTMPYSKY
jgi:hypothetical protein